MLDEKTISALGTPSIRFHSFQVWVHGREFPNQDDYWDGNWLRATAHCGAEGASVFATGAILHLSELQRWRDQVENLSRSLIGEANLDCIEPYVGLHLKAETLGHIDVVVSITPEHMTQRHWFQFRLDQTYLAPLLKGLAAILSEYPIRGEPREAPVGGTIA